MTAQPAEAVTPVNEAHRALLDAVRPDSRRRANEELVSAIRDGASVNELARAIVLARESPITHAFQPSCRIGTESLVDLLLREGKLPPGIETEARGLTRGEPAFTSRSLDLARICGGRVEVVRPICGLQPSEFPHHAILNTTRQPRGYGMSLCWYGFTEVTLSDSVKERSLVLTCDSCMAESHQAFLWSDLIGALCCQVPGSDRRWYQYVLNAEEPRSPRGSYLEVVVLGGIRLSTDVRTVRVAAGLDDVVKVKMMLLAQRYGIEVVQ